MESNKIFKSVLLCHKKIDIKLDIKAMKLLSFQAKRCILPSIEG